MFSQNVQWTLWFQETEIRRVRKAREADRLARHTDGTGNVTGFTRPSESGNNAIENGTKNLDQDLENTKEESKEFEKPVKKKKKNKKKQEKERKDSDADTEDGIPEISAEMDDLLMAADSVFWMIAKNSLLWK